MKHNIEALKAVLCDPEGKVRCSGSDSDRAIIQDFIDSFSPANAAGWMSMAVAPRRRKVIAKHKAIRTPIIAVFDGTPAEQRNYSGWMDLPSAEMFDTHNKRT